MSDFVMFIAGLMSLLLAVLRVRDDLVVMRKSLERVVESGQASVFILNERHQWDTHKRRRARRLKVLLDQGVEDDDALATVERELPVR